jgi:pyruvate-formate lyase-activating enzyme
MHMVPYRVVLSSTSPQEIPGTLSLRFFMLGCNLRCPGCHNALLQVIERPDMPFLSESQILEHMAQAEKLIDNIVITGGEPTLFPQALYNLVKLIRKQTNIPVYVATNGTNPASISYLSLWVHGFLLDVKGTYKYREELEPFLCPTMLKPLGIHNTRDFLAAFYNSLKAVVKHKGVSWLRFTKWPTLSPQHIAYTEKWIQWLAERYGLKYVINDFVQL